MARVRALVGPKAVIAATLDPHAHLSAAMTDHADILVAFKEYPRTDSLARSEELWTLALARAEGRARPVTAVHDCRMMDMFFTPHGPAADLASLMTAMEQRPNVLSVSLIHGFPWGDVPDFGTKALVIANGDAALAKSVAQELAEAVQAVRGTTRSPLISVSEAGIGDAAAAFIFDPIAVQIAKAAGVGARLPLRVGGKICAFSGPPLDLVVEVRSLTTDAIYDVRILQIPLGDLACVRVGGSFDLILTSKRSQCFSPNAFTDFGVDIAGKFTIIVKSMQHFTAGFGTMAGEILYVDSPAAASLDLCALPFKAVDRTLWPFSADRAAAAPA